MDHDNINFSFQTLEKVEVRAHADFTVLELSNARRDCVQIFIDRPNHAEIARAMADVWNTMTRADAEEVAK